MMRRRALLDHQGNISPKATPEDLETICSDPTYAHVLDQVAQHPSCWPELAKWVTLRSEDPAAAGAPPIPPARAHGRAAWCAPRIHVPNPLASLQMPPLPHKQVLMVGALLATAVTLMAVAPRLLGTAPAGISDSSTSSVHTASQEDVFSDARVIEQRAKKSPVWDEQLKHQAESLDKAMKAGDTANAETLASELDDMRLQKTRVRIGDVTSSLSDAIDRAATLKDSPASDDKKTMTALSDAWSAKSVDESNLAQAEQDARQLSTSVDAVQQDKDEADQARKREEERRKAKAEQEAQVNAERQPAQVAPQPTTPQQQDMPWRQTTQQTVPQPHPHVQQNRPTQQSGGTDGVAIG